MTATTRPWWVASSACTTTCVSASRARASSNILRKVSAETSLPSTTILPSVVMATVTSLALDEISLVAPLGRFTRTPARAPSVAMTDEVTMKMMSSTRKMSVSGVMLMSAKRSPSPLPSSPRGPDIAMVARPPTATA